MTTRLLTSRDNPLLKKIRLVLEQARRAPADLVVAEGVRVLEEITAAGLTLDAVLVGEGFGGMAREKALLDSWAASGVKTYRAADRVIQSLSAVVAPQGALALVRMPERKLQNIELSGSPLVVCACVIQDPGNLGSLIRTSVAAGATFLCTTPGTVSARNPKTIRSSAGALFRLPVVEHVAPDELLEYCRVRGIHLYRSSPSEGTRFTLIDFKRPVGILFGNEAQGLSERQWSALPVFRIPMAPGIESLNVAAAGAVVLFEAHRQRSEAASPSPERRTDWSRK
jgi:TrmH family RNA methyltransferase